MFQTERMIYHCNTAGDGLLQLGDAVAMLMDCCQFQEYDEKNFCHWLRSTDTAVFLAFIQLDILRRPAFREKVNVKVVIYDCQSIYGFRRITMRDEQGNLCMTSNAVGCFFNFRTGKAVRLPENIDDLLIMDPAEPMECLPRKIMLPRTEGIRLEPFHVMPSDLDLNKHLNSARYLSIAEDRLPEGFTFDRVRIEYKHQAAPGTILEPVLYETTPDTRIISLIDRENVYHATVEFSQRSEAAIACEK